MQIEVIKRIVREVLQERGLPGYTGEKAAPGRTPGPRSAPTVLSIFHPGVRKLEQALEQVRLIETVAAKSSVFTVSSARQWVCGEDVREASGVRCILDTVKPEGLEKVLAKTDVLVLPTFCFQTAAKLARLISDDPENAIVLSALIQGKPVLAARDGFTLWESLANEGIRHEIDRILAKLEHFGMVLCETEQLYTIFRQITSGKPVATTAGEKKTDDENSRKRLGLITAKDIQTAVNNRQQTIQLAPGGMITPLARDQAREHAIRIIQTMVYSGRAGIRKHVQSSGRGDE